MFQIYSNILYFVASIIAYLKNKKILSLLLCLVRFVSSLYHLNLNNQFWYLDVFISTITFLYGFFLFWKTKKQIVIYPTLIMIGILLYPKSSKQMYDKIHPWAHIFGGLSGIGLALYY